ncbi:MAG: HYR domain-containing protein, partial [Lutibacter sp.]|nr:HYR domain-containing protein [Lutibacter sp.]
MVKKLLKLKFRFFIFALLFLGAFSVYANSVAAVNTSFSILNTKAVVKAVNNTANIYGENITFSGNVSFVNYLWADTPTAQSGFKKVFQNLEVVLLKEEVLFDLPCPANIIVNNDPSSCSTVVNYTAPTPTPSTSNTVSQTSGLASGSDFPVGVTTNTFQEMNGAITVGSPCSFTVTVIDAAASASVSISASATTICAGTSVTFTATPVDGGATPTYQWQIGGVDISGETASTYTTSSLSNGQIVRVIMTSSLSGCGTTVTSNEITMTVNALAPVSFTIKSNKATICPGESVTFSTNAITNGGSPTYQWLENGSPISGATNSTYTTTALTGAETISLQLTSNVQCAVQQIGSNEITVTVNPNATISDPVNKNQTVCINNAIDPIAFAIGGGGTGATFSGLPAGVTGSYSAGTYTLSGTPTVSGIFNYTVNTTGTCAQTSQTGTITVTPNITISLSTSNNTQTVCENASISPISYTVGGSGNNASVTVLPAGITGSYNSGTFTISGSTTITGTFPFTVTATGPCANATATGSITIAPNLTPTVSITSSDPDNIICEGTSVTFTATPTNGGTSPIYQWKVNGANVGTNSPSYTTTALTNGQVVTVVMTSNEACLASNNVTSNSIETTVNPNLTPTVSTSATATTICASSSVTFTATPTNGGPTPSYQWKVGGTNVGTNSPTYTTTGLTNGQIVTVVLTSNATCLTTSTATSNPITMTVNPNLTPAVTISSDDANNIICAGTSVTFTASPTNGGASPSYQWKVNGTNVGTNSPTFTTSTLTNGQTVTVVLTSNATCLDSNNIESNPITMQVDSPISGITPVFDNTNLAHNPTAICPVISGLVYTINAIPGATSYNWTFPTGWTITSGGTTNSVTVTATSTAGSGNVTVRGTNDCGSSNTSVLAVSTGSFAYASAGPDQTVCAGTATITLAGEIGGVITKSNQWVWSSSISGGSFSGGGNSLTGTYSIPASIINGGSATITITTDDPAGSCNAAVDSMIITVLTAPTASINVTGNSLICSGSSSQITFTATPNTTVTYNINGGLSQTINVGGTNTAILNTGALISTSNYNLVSVGYSSGTGCTRAVSGTATITVTQLPTVNAGGPNTVCQSPTPSAITLSGATIGGGATTGAWSIVSGGGTLSSTAQTATPQNVTYTPAANYSGAVTLRLTTNAPGACAAVSSDRTITVTE